MRGRGDHDARVATAQGGGDELGHAVQEHLVALVELDEMIGRAHIRPARARGGGVAVANAPARADVLLDDAVQIVAQNARRAMAQARDGQLPGVDPAPDAAPGSHRPLQPPVRCCSRRARPGLRSRVQWLQDGYHVFRSVTLRPRRVNTRQAVAGLSTRRLMRAPSASARPDGADADEQVQHADQPVQIAGTARPGSSPATRSTGPTPRLRRPCPAAPRLARPGWPRSTDTARAGSRAACAPG